MSTILEINKQATIIHTRQKQYGIEHDMEKYLARMRQSELYNWYTTNTCCSCLIQCDFKYTQAITQYALKLTGKSETCRDC